MSERESSEPTVVVERRSGGGIGLFLLGVAVGAGLALLYAPQSGDETRQDLRRGARRLKRRARVLAEDMQESAEDAVRGTREVVRTTRAAARDAAREAREALERKLARHGRGAGDEDEDADA
jgi:gas vesicle protein